MAKDQKFPGGLLVGETDKNGGKGIKVVAPEGNIIVGGGELVLTSDTGKSTELHDFDGQKKTPCEIASDLNVAGGGVKIPCHIAEPANTTDSKMEVGDVIRKEAGGNISNDNLTELKNALSKYGWTAKISEDGKYYQLINRNGKIVSDVKFKGSRYFFFDMLGNKLMSGMGELGKSAERLAKEYFYANTTAAIGTSIPSESNEDKIDRLKKDLLALEVRGEGNSQQARTIKNNILELKNSMASGGMAKDPYINLWNTYLKFVDGIDGIISEEGELPLSYWKEGVEEELNDITQSTKTREDIVKNKNRIISNAKDLLDGAEGAISSNRISENRYFKKGAISSMNKLVQTSMAFGGITKDEKEVLKQAKDIWIEKRGEAEQELRNPDISNEDMKRYEGLLKEANQHLASFENGSMAKGGRTNTKKLPDNIYWAFDAISNEELTDTDFPVHKQPDGSFFLEGIDNDFVIEKESADANKRLIWNYLEKNNVVYVTNAGMVGIYADHEKFPKRYLIYVVPQGSFKPHVWVEGGLFISKESAEKQAAQTRKMKDVYKSVEVVDITDKKAYPFNEIYNEIYRNKESLNAKVQDAYEFMAYLADKYFKGLDPRYGEHVYTDPDDYYTDIMQELFNVAGIVIDYSSGGKLEKAKLKYAKKDINLLEKEHNIAITDTEFGVLWGSHKDGVFEFNTSNGTNIFKGGKADAIEFVKNAYTIGEMAKGGSVKTEELSDMLWILRKDGPSRFYNQNNVAIAEELVSRGLAEKIGNKSNEYAITKKGEMELMASGGKVEEKYHIKKRPDGSFGIYNERGLFLTSRFSKDAAQDYLDKANNIDEYEIYNTWPVKKSKYQIGDMVYSWQNKDYPAEVVRRNFSSWESIDKPHENDKWQYLVKLKNGQRSKWMSEPYLFKTKQRQYSDGGKTQLQIGIEVEKEHKDLYERVKKMFERNGMRMPISEKEFYKTIAKAHIREDKYYYDKLLKYVEGKK